MDLYCAIDLRAGEAVRLVQGDFARQRSFGDPLALARRYVAGGARCLHVVDLDAARTGEQRNRGVIEAIVAEVAVPVQVGGGVRSPSAVEELLGLGVARVVMGTAALRDPDMALGCAAAYPGRVALGLDYRRRADGVLEPAVAGWEEAGGASVFEVLAGWHGQPLGAVVVTAIERDGTGAGPDTDGLARVLDACDHPVVASGGVGSVADLDALAALRSPERARRVSGAIVGMALLDGSVGVEEALRACTASG